MTRILTLLISTLWLLPAPLLGMAGDGFKIERVEVRAFGVLCAEIATRVVSDSATRDRLLAVADDCLQGDAAARPSFERLVAALGNVN